MANNYLSPYNLHSIETIVSHFDCVTNKDNTPKSLCNILELVKNGGYFKEIIQEIRTTVDEKYKSSNIDEIGSSIRNCFENYEMVINEYSFYRDTIKTQKEELHNLAKKYFI